MANWDQIQQRGAVDDRRGVPGRAIGGMGLGMVALVVIFSLISGNDPSEMLDTVSQATPDTRQGATGEYAGLDSYEVFVSEVTGSADALWEQEFRASGLEYRTPKTVLFRGATESGCGGAYSQVGPHYCPADETIYLDE